MHGKKISAVELEMTLAATVMDIVSELCMDHDADFCDVSSFSPERDKWC